MTRPDGRYGLSLPRFPVRAARCKDFARPMAEPCSLLIHGRSNNWIDEQFEAQRLLNAGFTNLNVITYDQVLRRAKIIMGCNT